MPTYDFRCEEHGVEERICSVAARKEQKCSTCDGPMKQLILTAPALDEEGMAWQGMPGAVSKQGDRMEKQHRQADQAHRPAQR